MKNNALELGELVYAPINAVADANIRLGASTLDLMKSAADLSVDDSGKPSMRLKTIQLLFDRLNCGETGTPVRECVGVDMPLLSVVPMGGLQISKTKLSFGAEVLEVCTKGEDTMVLASPQKQNTETPGLSYEIELESVPIAEGLARFVDLLNTHTEPRTIHTEYLTEGNGGVYDYTAEFDDSSDNTVDTGGKLFTEAAAKLFAEETDEVPADREYVEPFDSEEPDASRSRLVPEYCINKRCMFISDCDFARETDDGRMRRPCPSEIQDNKGVGRHG